MAGYGIKDDEFKFSYDLAACTLGLHDALLVEMLDRRELVDVTFDVGELIGNKLIDVEEDFPRFVYVVYPLHILDSFKNYSRDVKSGVEEATDDTAMLALAASAVRGYLSRINMVTLIKASDRVPIKDVQALSLLAFMSGKYTKAGESGVIDADDREHQEVFDKMVIQVAVAYGCKQPISIDDLLDVVMMQRVHERAIFTGTTGYAS